MAEVWQLDGLALNDGTNFRIVGEIDLSPPKQRQEFISAADSEGAALMRAPQHENRTIVLPVEVVPPATKDLVLDKIGQVVDKLNKANNTPNGVPLVWSPNGSTRTVTFDVLAGEITELPDDVMFADSKLARLQVTLTCKPYGRGTEASVTAVASGAVPFVSVTVPSVPGDAPALGRLVVTDTAAQARRYVEWGLEQQDYSATPPVVLDSDSMTVTGFGGALATQAGAYDPNATGNNTVRATLQVVPVAVVGTGAQSHVGTFRVKARVVASHQYVYLRVAWQAGDGPLMANPWVTPPMWQNFTEVDLGTVTIPRVLSGTQQWTGRIEAYSAGTQGATLDVDYLVFMPAGEGYGRARGVFQYRAGIAVGYDYFTAIPAGTVLNARTAVNGGVWATSGAATDFAAVDIGAEEAMARSTASDTGPRYAILGATNYTDTEAQVAFNVTAPPGTTGGTGQAQVIARWTDANNYVFLRVDTNALTISMGVVIAGVTTIMAQETLQISPSVWYFLRLIVYASGRVIGHFTDASGTPIRVYDRMSTTLQTGGALATGKPGFSDYKPTATANTRYYDSFLASTPNAEPIAVYASRTIEIRHDDVIRQNSAGTVYGRPASYRGSRFLVPPAGTDNKTSRVVVKAARNDIETADHPAAVDAISAQVFYTPRYLVVPR